MDTWHILEQRFHEIANRDHCLAMTFEKEDEEKYWYSLHGGPGQRYLGNGRWAYVLIGAPHPDAPVSPPTIEKDDYCHSDLFETLQRAGRLINKDEGRSWSDWEGSRRFVKLLVQHYGSPVGLLFEDGDAKFFTNAARVCGMMAGKLAVGQVQKPSVAHSDNFNSVLWFGKQYTFTVNQAKVIERLWRAWERKTPAVPLVDLLEAAGSDAKRLRDVFKSGQTVNPAWIDKIIIDAGRGVYRLSVPKNKEPR